MSNEDKLAAYFELKGHSPLEASQMAEQTEREVLLAKICTQDEFLEFAESQAYKVEGYAGKHYSQKICDMMNKWDKRVHDDKFCCGWVAPFGFVPEAGCPKHDQ